MINFHLSRTPQSLMYFFTVLFNQGLPLSTRSSLSIHSSKWPSQNGCFRCPRNYYRLLLWVREHLFQVFFSDDWLSFRLVQSYADLAGPGINKVTKHALNNHAQWTEALLLYDTMLTFNDELKYIWRRKINLVTILYLAARYSMLSDMFFFWVCDIVSLEINTSQTVSMFLLPSPLFSPFDIICSKLSRHGGHNFCQLENSRRVISAMSEMGQILNTAAGAAIQGKLSAHTFSIFSLFRLPGILIARAYSVSKGNKILGSVLSLLLLTGLAISLVRGFSSFDHSLQKCKILIFFFYQSEFYSFQILISFLAMHEHCMSTLPHALS